MLVAFPLKQLNDAPLLPGFGVSCLSSWTPESSRLRTGLGRSHRQPRERPVWGRQPALPLPVPTHVSAGDGGADAHDKLFLEKQGGGGGEKRRESQGAGVGEVEGAERGDGAEDFKI